MCETCSHVQAVSGVKLSELYNDDYNYNTQNSGVQGRIAFFSSQLDKIAGIKFNRVIDVGCYNLSLLKEIKHKIKANYFIGIDPSIPGECLENEGNIICFKDYVDNVDIPYFNNDLPDLVISDQTFEHIPTINSTLGNIIQKVSENSIFAICVPSLEVLVEKLNFHNLIHEHVNYFSINTLSKLFALNKATLKSYTLSYTTTCGFLFGIFIKNNTRSPEVILGQKDINKDSFLKSYNLFRDLLEKTNQLIGDMDGERIYGFGASDITANLAYFMNSDFSFLTNILDDTLYKQEKYFPYLKPEIVSQHTIGDLSDSNCLITAPQAARYIYPRLNNLKFKRIINPIGLIS
jgi:cyclopropane-fatty-acyl-phospholipid synthase